MNQLREELEASEKKVDAYREKYKHEMNHLVEKKILSADKRVLEAEEKLKRAVKKSKEDIIAIRAELVAAASEAVATSPQTNTGSPKTVYIEAESALKKLKTQNPKRYTDLIKIQPEYVKLAAQMDVPNAAAGKQKRKRGGDNGSDNDQSFSAQSAGGATPSVAQAIKTLKSDLEYAAGDMRTNSSLANQRLTLVSRQEVPWCQSAARHIIFGKISR